MNIVLKISAFLVLALQVFGQNCQVGSNTPGTACTSLYAYDGSNNLIYQCKARSVQPTAARMSVSAASNANPVSLTSTAHGFSTLYQPLVTISNGTWTATITGANTLTIPVDSTSFGALAGTIVLTTNAPLTTQSVWSVMKFTYTGTNMTGSFTVAGSTAERNTCTGAPAQFQ
jgi:hypothetical protein